MKQLLLLLLILCCLPSLSHGQTPTAPAAPEAPTSQPTVSVKPSVPVVKMTSLKFIPEEVFNHELKEVGGEKFFLANYRGQVFVVNLWATWCGPCRMEIPEFNKLYREYALRGVEFIGLTSEDPQTDAEKVRQFAKEFKINYKLVWASREVLLPLMNGNTNIPQTFIVAPDGRIVAHFRGYSKQIPLLVRAGIEKALSATPVEPAAPAAPAAPVRP